MTPAELATLASAIQALFVAIAVVVGGIWALFRYRMLNESARASAELARLHEALEREPAITLRVGVEVFPAIGDVTRSMHVVARLHNTGKAPDVIDWSASGVSSARVTGFADGTPLFDAWRTTKLVTDFPWKGADVQPGEEATFGLLVPVAEPGVYCVEVFVALSLRSVEASSMAIAAAGVHRETPLELSSVAFVLVADDATVHSASSLHTT